MDLDQWVQLKEILEELSKELREIKDGLQVLKEDQSKLGKEQQLFNQRLEKLENNFHTSRKNQIIVLRNLLNNLENMET